MNTDHTLAAIDRTLTFHSTGLGANLTVPVETNIGPIPPEQIAAISQAVAALQQQLLGTVASAVAAMGPVLEAWLGNVKQFVASAGPLLAAVERRREWQRVLGRYNRPDLYATMWDRKTARNSRVWIVRSVGQ